MRQLAHHEYQELATREVPFADARCEVNHATAHLYIRGVKTICKEHYGHTEAKEIGESNS